MSQIKRLYAKASDVQRAQVRAWMREQDALTVPTRPTISDMPRLIKMMNGPHSSGRIRARPQPTKEEM